MSFAESNAGAAHEFKHTAGVRASSSRTLTTTTTLTYFDPETINLDPSAGGFTVTLPATPDTGHSFKFVEIANSANLVTIDGNGKNINGAANMGMNVARRARRIEYNTTSGEWNITGGIG